MSWCSGKPLPSLCPSLSHLLFLQEFAELGEWNSVAIRAENQSGWTDWAVTGPLEPKPEKTEEGVTGRSKEGEEPRQ